MSRIRNKCAGDDQQRQKEADEALQRLSDLARRQKELAEQQNQNKQQSFEQRWQQEMLRREAEELRKQMEQLSKSGQGQQGHGGTQPPPGKEAQWFMHHGWSAP